MFGTESPEFLFVNPHQNSATAHFCQTHTIDKCAQRGNRRPFLRLAQSRWLQKRKHPALIVVLPNHRVLPGYRLRHSPARYLGWKVVSIGVTRKLLEWS